MGRWTICVAVLMVVGWTGLVWGQTAASGEGGLWVMQWDGDAPVPGTAVRVNPWGSQAMMHPYDGVVTFWGKDPHGPGETDDDDTPDIFVVNVDGTGLVNLTGSVSASSNFESFWTGDGRLVFDRKLSPSLPGLRIHIMNSNGTGMTQLSTGAGSLGHTRPGVRMENPTTGDTPIVFGDESTGYLSWIRLGSNPPASPSAVNTQGGARPVFSPNGLKLAYRAGGSNAGKIAIQTWDPTHYSPPGDPPTGLRYITCSGLNMRGPWWRKDGVHLIVHDDNRLWQITDTGSSSTQTPQRLRIPGFYSFDHATLNSEETYIAFGGKRDIPQVASIDFNGDCGDGVSSIVGCSMGVKEIKVVFTEPMLFDQDDVLLQKVTFVSGEQVTGTVYPASVSGSGTNTMTITLDDGSAANTWLKVRLEDSIVDADGNQLDGDPPPDGSGSSYLKTSADVPSGNLAFIDSTHYDDSTLGGDAVFYVGSCVGEASGSGAVNIFDAFLLNQAWGSQSGDANYNHMVDFDHSGSINIFDAYHMNSGWGTELEPLQP